MRLFLFLLLLPWLLAGQEESAAAPEVVSDATPESFRDAEAGFSIRLAGGFGFLARQESLVLFGSKSTPGMVFLELGESFTEQELVEASRSGYQEEGVSLTPTGEAIRLHPGLGKGIAFPVRGSLDGQRVEGLLAGVRHQNGRCFIVLVATTPESWPKLAGAAQQIVNGIALGAPEAPQIDPQMRSYFAGTRLSFYFSRASRSTLFQGKEQIYLCGNGTFFYGEQTSASFDVPQAMGYSRTGDNSAGKWQAAPNGEGALLSLVFNDGRQWRYQATRMGSGLVYLNGSKYFRSGQNRCR